MADINTTSSTIAMNETQPEYGSQAFYITWYILAGFLGLVGNTFLLVVYCNAARLRTARLVVSWLAFVDLIGCLTIPFRYLMLFHADKLSRPLCIGIPFFVIFSTNLTTFSLVVAAIERYRKVRFINKQYRNDTIIFVSIVLSVLIALSIAAISRLHIQPDTYIGDAFHCEPKNHKSSFETLGQIGNVLRILKSLIMFCCIFIITFLYVKIALLLRRRIGIHRTQQQSDCTPNSEHNAVPREEVVLRMFNSPEEQNETCELWENDTNPNLNMQPVAEIDDIMPEIESIIPVSVSEKQQDSVSTSSYLRNDIWTSSLSRSSSPSTQDAVPASVILSPHSTSNLQSNDAYLFTQAKPTSISKVEPESGIVKGTPVRPHVASTLHLNVPFNQLPGVVLEDENISINHPPVSPRDVSELSTGNQEPTIPTLESDERNNHLSGRNLITKTTLMLFIATVICIVTYGLFVIFVFLLDIDKVSHFFMEFVLINHFINPFVYNFVNESFRGECRAFFKKLELSKCVQR